MIKEILSTTLLLSFFISQVYGQCPKNMVIKGENLIKNGDFNQGNESFRSDYSFRRHFFIINEVQEAEYSIQINPLYAESSFAQCFGWDGIDNSMMVVKGDNKPSALVWGQKVFLKENETYNFSFWLSSLKDEGSHPISFRVLVGGKILGDIEHSQIKTCNWKEYNFHWLAKKEKEVEIKIVSTYEGGERGNNFAIDGLVLYTCHEQPKEQLMAFLDESINIQKRSKLIEEEIIPSIVDTKSQDIEEGEKQKESIEEQITQLVSGNLKSITLDNIFFEFGKSTLKPNSYKELDELASILNTTFKDKKIKIMGHTDNIGSESSNLALSRNRARSVMTYLLTKKVDYNRITSEGYGSSKPIDSNDTEEGRQSNRRVEFKLL